MKKPKRQFAAKRYLNRFRYLFFGFYQSEFIRSNSKDIRDSILIGTTLISLSSIIQILLLDYSILDDSIRNRVILIRTSFIILPVFLYLYLKKPLLVINRFFGNYLTGLIVLLLFLHLPLMLVDPSNHSYYLLNSSIILLGCSVILWMEPIRIGYIALGYIFFLIPMSINIAEDLGFSPQIIVQNILLIFIIVSISFIANTMINYWRFEDYRSNKRLKKTLKNLKLTTEKIRIISHKDSLTDLYNRRYLLEAFETRAKQSSMEDLPFGIVILDLDHLKKINDQYGHIQGDRSILEFSEILKRNTNSKDIIARIGGDEFCLITDWIKKEDLARLIEKIRYEISLIKITVYNNPELSHGLTASIGAILVNEKQVRNFDVLYHSIDEALYRAKIEGRNKAILLD
ncbi:MAG: GGDEF domain-containing protein [Leptospira sp.]|nr:GGDEF domain-containing protein [Leptospira sp.]